MAFGSIPSVPYLTSIKSKTKSVIVSFAKFASAQVMMIVKMYPNAHQSVSDSLQTFLVFGFHVVSDTCTERCEESSLHCIPFHTAARSARGLACHLQTLLTCGRLKHEKHEAFVAAPPLWGLLAGCTDPSCTDKHYNKTWEGFIETNLTAQKDPLSVFWGLWAYGKDWSWLAEHTHANLIKQLCSGECVREQVFRAGLPHHG